MAEDNGSTDSGSAYERIERGYQPVKHQDIPTGDPKPQSGYQPSSEGDNPSNQPTPPGDE